MYLTLAGLDENERQQRFAVSVRGLIEELGYGKYLWTEAAGHMCDDGHATSMDLEVFRRRIIAQVGSDLWEDTSLPATLDLLKISYQLASKPKEVWYHQFCGNEHPTDDGYDQAKARYELTVAVNERLRNFGIELQMRSGGFATVVPVELDPLFTPLEGGLDRQAALRVQGAIAAFKRGGNRRDAVWQLVQAFERVKTIFDSNKQAGAQAFAVAIAPHPDLVGEVGTAFKALTEIGHEAFRHDETTRPIALEEADLDYWFMQFLVLLRAADRALAQR